MTESSFKNNQALENINDKFLEIMNDSGIIASYLMSLLSKILSPEKTTHFQLVKHPISNGVNDSLIHITITVSLNNNLLTFFDGGKVFEMKADLSKMITNKN